MNIAISSVCTAFELSAVGTRADKKILEIVSKSLETHDQSKDRAEGQHFIMLPSEALDHVSSGVARRTANISDYHVRMWRGMAQLFMKRWCAEPPAGVAAVVYTREAYGKDPDVTKEEIESMGDATHVLVAVLAFAGPQGSPPAPWTFVRNLAGANNEDLALSGDEIRAKATAVADYHSEWCVVAD